MVHVEDSKCTDKGGGIVQIVRTVCLNRVVGSTVDQGRREEINQNVKKLLNMISECGLK